MIQRFKTSKQREEEAKRTQRLFSIAVAVILMLSTAGFALLSSSRNTKGNSYYDFQFTPTSEGWETKAGDYYVVTSYLPQEVENIEHSGILQYDDFQGIIYFIARTDAEKEAADEIDKHMTAAQKEHACLPEDSESEDCINKSIKSCSNANFVEKIIIFEELNKEGKNESSKASIDYSSNCLTIKGNSADLLRAADKALFLMFGIIKQNKEG